MKKIDKKTLLGNLISGFSFVIIGIMIGSSTSSYNFIYNSKDISAVEYCYSNINTTDYDYCYTFDEEYNYKIENFTNNSSIFVVDGNQSVYKNEKLVSTSEQQNPQKVESFISVINETGLTIEDLEKFNSNYTATYSQFDENDKLIAKNYFKNHTLIETTSISYSRKGENYIVTLSEANNIDEVIFKIKYNNDVPNVELPIN